MMFTGGIEGDLSLDHHLTVICMEGAAQMYAGVFLHSAKDLLIHPGDAVRGIQKSFPGNVFPDSF